MGRLDWVDNQHSLPQWVVVISGSLEIRTQVSYAAGYLVGVGKTSEVWVLYKENGCNVEELVWVIHHCECAPWVIHFPSLSVSFFICKMGITMGLTHGLLLRKHVPKFVTHTRYSYDGMEEVEFGLEHTKEGNYRGGDNECNGQVAWMNKAWLGKATSPVWLACRVDVQRGKGYIWSRQVEELELDPVGNGEPWSNEQDGKRIRFVFRKKSLWLLWVEWIWDIGEMEKTVTLIQVAMRGLG